MNAAIQTPAIAPIFEIPEPPERFGEDGGKFYRCYDNLAEELDDDMTKGLKEQLDGMLIFAGLFAGVNTAFLALTIPLLSPDSTDDTNALITQNNVILMQLVMGTNDSLPTTPTLPSTSFSPSSDIFAINALFSLSLAFAVISSFLAVLGRQWLVYYRKRGGGGPDRQRWEQLKRFLGAERWKLEPILDDVLPSLLQIGLLIFCTSFILYLHYLNPRIALIVGIPMGIGLAFFFGSALCPLWDRFCPFHSPLSHSLSWATHQLSRVLLALKAFCGTVRRRLREGVKAPVHEILSRNASRTAEVLGTHGAANTASIASKLQRWIKRTLTRWLYVLRNGRQEESILSLQVVAVQRTICISGDTLLHAIANILAIEKSVAIQQLWSRTGFRAQFASSAQLCSNAVHRARGYGIDSSELAASFKRLHSSAVTHMMFIMNEDGMPDDLTLHFCRVIGTLGSEASPIPATLLAGSSPNLIHCSILSATVSNILKSRPGAQNLHNYLAACSEIFITRSDLQFCGVLSIAIIILHRKDLSGLEGFRKAYQVDTEALLRVLKNAFEILLMPKSKEWLDCDRVIVNMLRGIRRMTVDDQYASKDVRTNLKLLEICEKILRDSRLSGDARWEGRALRTGIEQLWRRENLRTDIDIQPEATSTWSQAMLLYFGSIHKLEVTERTQDEDIDVARVFHPMMSTLFTRSLLSSPLQDTFNRLVLDAYRRSHTQTFPRRARHPDERWCYYPEERLSIERWVLDGHDSGKPLLELRVISK